MTSFTPIPYTGTSRSRNADYPLPDRDFHPARYAELCPARQHPSQAAAKPSDLGALFGFIL